MMEKDTYMTVDRKVSSIESSFRIEGMPFNEECRKRVKDVLTKNMPAVDAIAELSDTPTRVLANGRGFLRHGRTPQRAITSPLHPVTSLPLSRLFCGYLF